MLQNLSDATIYSAAFEVPKFDACDLLEPRCIRMPLQEHAQSRHCVGMG